MNSSRKNTMLLKEHHIPAESLVIAIAKLAIYGACAIVILNAAVAVLLWVGNVR